MVKPAQYVGTLERVWVCLLYYHGFRLPFITQEKWPSSRMHAITGILGGFVVMPYCLFTSAPRVSTWYFSLTWLNASLSFDNPPPLTKTSTNSESHARPSSETDQVCKSPSHRNIQRMHKEPGTERLLWYR
ncbi:hypothetical protein FJTKL_14643 [Diaporthe vaccinii]|uniref:Uncharacterized protein n=1 Tax=Diaporthe vaccinii TaxID=105482 RepID=A0ABR4E730_9PEZI